MSEPLRKGFPVGTSVTYRNIVHVHVAGTWKIVESQGVVTAGYCKPGHTPVRESMMIKSGDSFKLIEKAYTSCLPTDRLFPSRILNGLKASSKQ